MYKLTWTPKSYNKKENESCDQEASILKQSKYYLKIVIKDTK